MNRLYSSVSACTYAARACVIFACIPVWTARPGCNPTSDPFTHINTCACAKYWGKTYFFGRPQGDHEYLFLMGEPRNRHTRLPEKWRGDIDVFVGWDQNFNQARQSSYFLGRNGMLTIGPNNQDYDVRNSDLGLPYDLTGEVALSPAYANFQANLQFFVSSPHGWWGEFRLPFVHSKWTNRVITNISTASDLTVYTVPADYVTAAYQNQTRYVVNNVDEDVNLAFTGNDAIVQALRGDSGFGDAPRLDAGKLATIRDVQNGMGDLLLGIGGDFLRRPRYNFGIGINMVAPAINQPKQNLCPCDLYYFESIIGTLHAWKVGPMLRGQVVVYQNDNSDRTLELLLDARAYAAIHGKSTRMLGLRANKGCAFNHWLLLKKFAIKADGAEYVGLERAANLLKAYVQTKTYAQGEATALLAYRHHGVTGEFGYNFFGRQAECVDTMCFCRQKDIDTYLYVIKDDAPVRGNNAGTTTGGFYSNTTSDISSTGAVVTGSDVALTAGRILVPTDVVRNAAVSFNHDVVPGIAMHPTYLSHTIFGSLGYTWLHSKFEPAVTLMAKVELGQNNAAWDAWGIWAKGSLIF